MITIKYKGIEATCTTVDEAVKLIKKLDLEKDNTIIIQPNVPNPTYPYIPYPYDPITHPNVTWETEKLGFGYGPDCDKCPNKPKPGEIIIGDTPCTWCLKNKFYCANTTDGMDFKITATDTASTIEKFKKEYMPEFTIPDKCKDCPIPCEGGSDYPDCKGRHTNCIKEAKFSKESK